MYQLPANFGAVRPQIVQFWYSHSHTVSAAYASIGIVKISATMLPNVDLFVIAPDSYSVHQRDKERQ